MARIKYPAPGTPVAVYWEDIYEDVVGDPDAAETAERVSYGIYMGRRKKNGRVFLVTSTTREGWEAGLYGDGSGWCSYPVGTVVKMVPLSEDPGLLEVKVPKKETRWEPEPKTLPADRPPKRGQQ